jgi:hypothetical protein
MAKPISIFLVLALSTLVAISQTNGQTMKECRITAGVGIAGATEMQGHWEEIFGCS